MELRSDGVLDKSPSTQPSPTRGEGDLGCSKDLFDRIAMI
jgi:hypothetical protein